MYITPNDGSSLRDAELEDNRERFQEAMLLESNARFDVFRVTL